MQFPLWFMSTVTFIFQNEGREEKTVSFWLNPKAQRRHYHMTSLVLLFKVIYLQIYYMAFSIFALASARDSHIEPEGQYRSRTDARVPVNMENDMS